jgi:hypothetical protein
MQRLLKKCPKFKINMKNTKILDSLNRIGTFLGGAIGYHLVDRALSYYESQVEEIKQINRDEKFNEAIKEAKSFYSHARDQFKVLQEAAASKGNSDGQSVSAVVRTNEDLVNCAKSIKLNSNSIMSKLSELNIPNWEKSDVFDNMKVLMREAEKLTKLLENEGNKTNFLSIPNFPITKLYEYLDSLTMLQESSLLHIIMFSILLITVINILGVLFGDFIIKYFNLEKSFPKLGIFFRLRAKYQRYYLIYNVILLFTVCIFGIGLNILLFILIK